MQLHQLEYVLAVAKYKGFTKAAEEINISQSSISQQINSLEKELGVSLFIRTTRSVQLTPAGEDFVIYATRIMNEIESANRCIQEYVSVIKGQLTIGIIPVVGHYFIPEIIASYQKKYPKVKVNLIESQDNELLELLHLSDIHAAFTQKTSSDLPLKHFPLIKDQMVILLSSNHPLAYKKSLDLSKLKNELFILTPNSSGHNHDFQNACRKAGFEPRVLMTCSSVQTMLSLVNENLGVTVLSSRVAYTMIREYHDIKILELAPKIERSIYLSIHKNINISPALKSFINATSQWVDSKRTQHLAYYNHDCDFERVL